MIGIGLQPAGLGRVAPQPLAGFFRHGGGQKVAVGAGSDGGHTVWTEIGPAHAACLRYDNNNPALRLSWRETLITELRMTYPVGMLTLAGSWSQLQSSGSGLSASYTGNRAVSTGSAAATATVTVGRAAPYDVWVHYTGRTSGGYMRVRIDGGDALVNEIGDPAGLGFKAFSTYHATDLTRRQAIKVASGLTGDHVVTLSYGGVASPGGAAILLEAVAITGSLFDPHILPPVWQPATAYTMGDEVQFGGTFYVARATGNSGVTGPTHLSGIASDGALDWRADNRPTYPAFVAMDYASEREYAARVDVGGAISEIGGQTHGNDMLQSRTMLLDDAPIVLPTTGTGLAVGARITIAEVTRWQQQAGGALADCQLDRVITPGKVQHFAELSWTGAAAIAEWLYAAMAPLVHWDGEMQQTVITHVAAPETVEADLSNFSGSIPANVDFPAARRLGLTGMALGQVLTCGVEAGTIPVPGNRIAGFDAFLRPNIDGRTASGSLDWTAKAYVSVAGTPGLTLSAGDALGFSSTHVFAIG